MNINSKWEGTELTSGRYRVEALTDEAGVVLTSLDSLTITLFDKRTGAIINSRGHQPCLNAANVAFPGDGSLTWLIQPADRPILDATLPFEEHVAIFEFTYAGGTKHGKWVIQDRVDNLSKVPA